MFVALDLPPRQPPFAQIGRGVGADVAEGGQLAARPGDYRLFAAHLCDNHLILRDGLSANLRWEKAVWAGCVLLAK